MFRLHLHHRLHLSENGIKDADSPLVCREQDAATEYSAPKPHTGASPEAFDAIVGLAALAAGLDCVEWLSSQSSHDTRHTSVGEIGDNSLWDLLLGLVVFQNVVRAHSKRSGTRLLQCCSSKATVKTQDAVFLPDSRHRVRRASESSLIPRVVYQRSLHTLGGRDCKKTCDDTAHHAGPKTP
jgi:hypothetical protein